MNNYIIFGKSGKIYQKTCFFSFIFIKFVLLKKSKKVFFIWHTIC